MRDTLPMGFVQRIRHRDGDGQRFLKLQPAARELPDIPPSEKAKIVAANAELDRETGEHKAKRDAIHRFGNAGLTQWAGFRLVGKPRWNFWYLKPPRTWIASPAASSSSTLKTFC
jgi:hypothetical protein